MGQCQLKFDATISRKKLDRKIDARNFYLVDRLGSNDFTEKLDGKKYDVNLQPAMCTSVDGLKEHGTGHGFFRTNTSRYNKIMFQATNMVFIALFLVGTLIFFSIDRKYFNDAILYCRDFAPPLMLNIVFPIIFFARNKDAVSFTKRCITCR